jgi:twitching motility protein PilT
VAENIRSIEKSLSIPDLIADGSVSYKMQTFDQSLMGWFKSGVISYESALHYATNPSEFALRAAGVTAASDRTFTDPDDQSAGPPRDLTREMTP